jgi:hypothetical protein
MAMPIGTIDHDGRRYFRCLECGDSQKRAYIAHAFVDRNGNTYCYRCQHSSRLSVDQYIDLLLGETTIDEIIQGDWKPPQDVIRHYQGRETLLVKYFDPSMQNDCFSMRNQRGQLIGWHERKPNKVMHNQGQRGINWYGADDGIELISSPDNCLDVVEGPFDVTATNRVPVFGEITYGSLRQLRYQHLVLWPDPDVLDSPYKRKAFVNMAQRVHDNLAFVHGIKISNADPDRATKVRYIPLNEAIQKVRQYV